MTNYSEISKREKEREYNKKYLAEYRKRNHLLIMGDATKRRVIQAEERREKQREYKKLPRVIEMRRKYYQRGIEKDKARKALRIAVKNGLVIKGLCILCGSDNVQGHHEDYSKPLDVVWLCDSDHKKFEKVKRVLEFMKKEGKDG